jgi:hypothetical protein
MWRRMGAAASAAALLPPTMKVSVPASAPAGRQAGTRRQCVTQTVQHVIRAAVCLLCDEAPGKGSDGCKYQKDTWSQGTPAAQQHDLGIGVHIALR